MTIHVKVGEAKTRLSELLAKAEAGEEVIISRGHQQVAKLVALQSRDRVRTAIENIKARRKTVSPVTLQEILAWRDEGRK